VRAFSSCDTTTSGYTYHEVPVAKRMIEMLCNDFNTPGMFGVLFESLGSLTKRDELCVIRHILTDILGLTLQELPEKNVEITPEIQNLIEERNAARAQKDWARADELRKQLKELGYQIEDKKMT
jgi:cysteinyl-tRNA synthetase